MTFCIINNELIAAQNAAIPIQDRGFRYGDGVFETLAVVSGVPYQFEWHMKRLAAGLKAIRINYDTTSIAPMCRELLHANHLADGFLRIQVTRGSGSKGYLPDAATPNIVIETMTATIHAKTPVRLWQSSYSKPSASSLPVQYKLCQGLNQTLSRMEAVDHDCFDELLLNERGQVCETSSGTIFWCVGSTIFTPAVSCGLLEGSTRAALMRLLPSVSEVEVTIDELQHADAVIICNVSWKALAVSALLPLGKTWDSEGFAAGCLQRIEDDRRHYSHEHRNMW